VRTPTGWPRPTRPSATTAGDVRAAVAARRLDRFYRFDPPPRFLNGHGEDDDG
jgi:hypothetical protein